MTPFPVVLQHKMTRLHGHLFLAPGAMYFVCGKQGGAWAQAIGQGVGGALGRALARGPRSATRPRWPTSRGAGRGEANPAAWRCRRRSSNW
ncbi:MAG: hypothetical protein R2939_10095 [Kofleriaceae bacterium]